MLICYLKKNPHSNGKNVITKSDIKIEIQNVSVTTNGYVLLFLSIINTNR